MKKGTSFELLAKNIFEKLSRDSKYETVEHNVKLMGQDGPRQIDVLITANVAGLTLKTIIECKDYRSKISVGKIDALHSVMLDVNANKAVMVSTNGFSKTAIKKAERLGISLFTAHQALKEDWSIELEIPVNVKEVLPIKVNPKFIAKFSKGDTFHKESVYIINDVNIMDEFQRQWKEGVFGGVDHVDQGVYSFEIPGLEEPFYFRSVTGQKMFLEELNIEYKVQVGYYCGYLDQQENTKVLHDIIERKTQVFFESTSLFNYRENFQYSSKQLFPEGSSFSVECMAKPAFHFTAGTLNIGRIEKG
ncbi:restriction endonuclease [Shewanella waksmanii]|uniref:restriction endonuclease n=1 Tax=Shewanella waksmanii TaxID=213783 RepID=UPI0037358AF8